MSDLPILDASGRLNKKVVKVRGVTLYRAADPKYTEANLRSLVARMFQLVARDNNRVKSARAVERALRRDRAERLASERPERDRLIYDLLKSPNRLSRAVALIARP